MSNHSPNSIEPEHNISNLVIQDDNYHINVYFSSYGNLNPVMVDVYLKYEVNKTQ